MTFCGVFFSCNIIIKIMYELSNILVCVRTMGKGDTLISNSLCETCKIVLDVYQHPNYNLAVTNSIIFFIL